MSLPDFDRPFGAGSSAEFFPGSLATDFSYTRKEILELDPGRRMAEALAAAPPHATRGAIFASIPWAAKQFLAVRAHEQDHLRRTLSTTYGFLADTVRCDWLKCSGRLIRERCACDADTLYPLLPPQAPNCDTFDAALLSLSQASTSVAHTASLVVGLADLLAALTDNVAPARFASALWALSNAQRDRVAALSSGIDVSSHLCSADPDGLRFGSAQGISARHLLELFAIGEHGNGYLRTGSSLEDVVSLLGGAQREYVLAILAWEARFPNVRLPAVGLHSGCETDLMFDWYRLYPFELYVAADLALWPPFFPIDGLGVAGDLGWVDIDPGRRFVRILAAFEEMQIRPALIPAEGRNARFLEVQERVCQRLGWPTPKLLANEWLAYLKTHRAAATSPWFALDGESTFRVENAVRLLTIRDSAPADLVLNNVEFAKHGLEGSPIWIIREDGGRRTPLPMGPLGPKLLLPMMMLEGTRHLFNRDRPILTPAYESNFREGTVESIGRMMELIAGWEPGLRPRFLDETHREMRTGRTAV